MQNGAGNFFVGHLQAFQRYTIKLFRIFQQGCITVLPYVCNHGIHGGRNVFFGLNIPVEDLFIGQILQLQNGDHPITSCNFSKRVVKACFLKV